MMAFAEEDIYNQLWAHPGFFRAEQDPLFRAASGALFMETLSQRTKPLGEAKAQDRVVSHCHKAESL
jgi:hypothetical protein